MKIKKLTPQRMRQFLITFNVCLTYFVFTIFGMIIVKYNYVVIQYVDIFFVPIGLSSILFLYLFALTYENKLNIKLSDTVKECARLYGLGWSFERIKDELNLNNPNDVKRLLTEFCKCRS